MFHRGWFHISVEDETVGAELSRLVQQYGTARLRLACGRPDLRVDASGRFAGVIAQCAGEQAAQSLERLRRAMPELSVLALLAEADVGYVNALQALGIEVALLPVVAPVVVAFVQRALASTFLPNERVARVVAWVAQERELTPREVQILSYCLGNEPRDRVRRRLGISENTLKTQVKGLLRKCEARSVDALAKNLLRIAVLGDLPALPVQPWVSTPPSPVPPCGLQASA